MKTKMTLQGRLFCLNGKPVYSEIPACPKARLGMLMNARMIQGVFDDAADAARFNRFGRVFDPEKNTDDLIAALPEWYQSGLRAITVGFQGGGPCCTIDVRTIRSNPFSPDGTSLDKACAARMKKLIDACDALGMVLICSFFYGHQCQYLADDQAVMNAVKTASNWLREQACTNVIIEIANEQDITAYRCHPILFSPEGIALLIDIARRESGGMPTGCSRTGGTFSPEIARASDVILLHGNDSSRQRVYEMICRAKEILPARPILINEDSQALSNMQAAVNEGVSWGYYNNMTKQEPPADWGITPGEDFFFARRMAGLVGIPAAPLAPEDRFYLQGLEKNAEWQGKRWIRLAGFHAEDIDRVDFYRCGVKVGTSYDDPFFLNSVSSNWFVRPFPETIEAGERWEAVVFLRDGTTVQTAATAE